MFKKTVSILLAVCILCFCLLPAAAQNTSDKIAIKLNSNIAGLTENDVQKLIELKSDNVVYSSRPSGAVSISDYAGTMESGKLVAGRTYNIYYMLSAAEGFTIPDELTDDNITIECGKGVSVIARQVVSERSKTDNGFVETYRGIRIYAVVKVDGNFFQRMIGWMHDMILKIKAWSLY